MSCIEDKLELAVLFLQFDGNKNFEFVRFLKKYFTSALPCTFYIKVLEGAYIGCFRELFGDSTVLVGGVDGWLCLS